MTCWIGGLGLQVLAVEEEETEADVLGLLEFRECEMRQLELSLGESVTWFEASFNLLIRCCA